LIMSCGKVFCLSLLALSFVFVVTEVVIEYVTVSMILKYPMEFSMGITVQKLKDENKLHNNVDLNDFENSDMILRWIPIYNVAFWYSPIDAFYKTTIDNYVAAYGPKPFLYAKSKAEEQSQGAGASLDEINHVFFVSVPQTASLFGETVYNGVSYCYSSFKSGVEKVVRSIAKTFGFDPSDSTPNTVFNVVITILAIAIVFIVVGLIAGFDNALALIVIVFSFWKTQSESRRH